MVEEMKSMRVTHTLHNSQDGLVTEEAARKDHLYVELQPYCMEGTVGDYCEAEGYIRTAFGDEYYIPPNYLEEVGTF